jgi:chromosome segregation ATPase
MDNYRLSQTQLQEKLHEQISNKDEHIAELTGELARRTNQVSALTLEGEQLRFRLKEVGEEVAAGKEANRSLMAMVEGLQQEEEDLKKQVQSLKASLDNQGRTKENKEKHFTQELAKYTQRYLESEQERNKIVFQLESKFKEEIEKKESNYRALIANNDKKHSDTISALKQRVKQLEAEATERAEAIDKQVHEARRLNDQLNQRGKELAEALKDIELITQ